MRIFLNQQELPQVPMNWQTHCIEEHFECLIVTKRWSRLTEVNDNFEWEIASTDQEKVTFK